MMQNRLGLKAPAACSSPGGGGGGGGGHAPPESFEIFGITRCFLRHFGD